MAPSSTTTKLNMNIVTGRAMASLGILIVPPASFVVVNGRVITVRGASRAACAWRRAPPRRRRAAGGGRRPGATAARRRLRPPPGPPGPRRWPASTSVSPLRSDEAPLVTSVSPSDMPLRASTRVSSSMPIFEGQELGLVVGRHREDAALGLVVDNRRLRHQRGPDAAVDGDAHARIHPGLEAVRRVGHFDFDFGRARRRVEHRRDAGDAALERLAGKRVDFDEGRVAGVDQPQVAFDDVGDQAHRADVDDRHDRGLRARPTRPGRRCACRRSRSPAR